MLSLHTLRAVGSRLLLLGCTLGCALLSHTSHAQLNAGDIMFVAYNADGDDGFSIVALNDIPANTVIYFNDNEWNGSAIGAGGAFNSTGEGEMRWHVGGSLVAAGTVVTFDETASTSNTNFGASVGTLERSIALNASNEVLYAFLGTDSITPTTFLSAIANDGFNSTNGTLDNTGLTAGTNAVAITGDEDVMVFNGSTACNGTYIDCMTEIATASNWDTQDGSGAQDDDATAPDFPGDVVASFSGTALPVELLFFNGTAADNGTVTLVWETASEINNDYFEIYRSTDGIYWEDVQTVSGKGTSAAIHHYRIEDGDVPTSVETVYYKMVQVDFNGTTESFDPIKVELSPLPSVEAYPNPVQFGRLFLRNTQAFDRATLVDLSGKPLRHFQMFESVQTLDLKVVQPGLYLLQLSGLGKQQTIRVQVK